MRSSATRLTAGIASICSGRGGRRSSSCRRGGSPRRPRRGRAALPTVSIAWSAPPPVDLADLRDALVAGRDGVGGAELARELELLGDDVDRDDCPAPASTAPSSAERPTPPRPKTATRSPGLDPRRVDRGADAGEDRAAEQRGELEGQLGVDLHRRARGDDDVVGEGGDAEVVVELVDRRGGSSRRSPLSSVPAALAAAPGSQSAARPARQGPQLAAGGDEGEDDVVARREAARRSAPVSTTSPAASWPSAIGITRGREPSITERSEWQRPAAPTRTSSSPGPGGASSSSTISSGRDSA